MKLLGLLMVVAGTASFAFAGVAAVPEIDASSAVSAVALISGGMLILRARRAKR